MVLMVHLIHIVSWFSCFFFSFSNVLILAMVYAFSSYHGHISEERHYMSYLGPEFAKAFEEVECFSSGASTFLLGGLGFLGSLLTIVATVLL